MLTYERKEGEGAGEDCHDGGQHREATPVAVEVVHVAPEHPAHGNGLVVGAA